jgi:hypothetical protein
MRHARAALLLAVVVVAIAACASRSPRAGDAAPTTPADPSLAAPPSPVAASLRGSVVDRDTGAPIFGAKVEALPARRRTGGRAPARSTAGPRASGTTDADGRFELSDVSGGVFVRVSLKGYAADFRQVEAPSAEDLRFALARGATLRGRVLDVSGAPILGATLRSVADVYAADAEGRFVVADLSPDERPELVVRAPGFAATPYGGPWPPGDAAHDVVLQRERVLDVAVVDDDGAPVLGARLLGRLPHAEAYSELERADFEATTDAAGRARLTGLPPNAPVVVNVSVDGRPDAQSDVVLPREAGAAVAATDPIRVVASRGRKLELKVVDAQGDPIGGARVRVDHPVPSRLDFRGFVAREGGAAGPPTEVKTSADGTAILQGLPSTLLRVDVSAPGFKTLTLPYELSRDDALPVATLQKDDVPTPPSVPWRESIGDAFREADATGRPVLLALAMDGETANDALAKRHFRDPDVVRALDACVPVLGSAFGGVYADPNDPNAHREIDGVCSRYGSCSCASHQATERWAVDSFFGGARTFAVPRHMAIATSGAVVENRGYYLSERDLENLAIRALRRTRLSDAVALATARFGDSAALLRDGDADRTRRLARLSNAGDEYSIALLVAAHGYEGAFERGVLREAVIGAPRTEERREAAAAPDPFAEAASTDPIAATAGLRELRRRAAFDVASDEAVFDAFLARRADRSALVREEAIAGLAESSETPADVLRTALADSVFEVRLLAACGLLRRGEDSGREAVEEGLRHPQYGPLARAALDAAGPSGGR